MQGEDTNNNGIDKDPVEKKQQPKAAPKKAESKKTQTKAAKKAGSKKATSKKSAASLATSPRKVRAYPIGPFEESFEFSKSIYEFGSGQRVRRLAIFNELGKSPDSGPSRMLLTNGNKNMV